MENPVRPLLLTVETQAVLTRIRTYGWTLFVFGMSPGEDGDSAAITAQVLLEKWAARGLDPRVLATVRSQVFYIPEPPKK